MTGSDQKDQANSVDEKNIEALIANWEIFEELVEEVYSKGEVEPTDRHLFGSLKLAIQRYYLQLADELRPFWMQVKIAGQLLKNDPFAELLDTPGLSAFLTNWDRMQMVPAAREALNLLLVSNK
jgi:hypothetical protein